MLSIDREPLYKNKLLLSSLAVFSGFVITVGIIRVTNPLTDSTSQSTQSSNDRRASSLIPINGSESETASESDTSKSRAGATAGTQTQPVNGSTWTTSTTSPSSSPGTSPGPTSSSSSTPGTTSTTPAVSAQPSNGGGALDPVTCGVLNLTCP